MQRECYSFHPHTAIKNLSVSLDSGIGAFPAFAFLARYHSTVHDPTKNIKTLIPMYFWISWYIHTFKNYFVTIFSVINFQFSINK